MKTISLGMWLLVALLGAAVAQAQPRGDSLSEPLAEAPDSARVDALNALADAYGEDEPKKGLATGAAALEAAQALGYTRGEAEANMRMGRAYASLGRHEEASRTYERAVALYRTLQDDGAAGVAYSRWADALGQTGAYDEALEAYETAIELLESVSDVPETALAYNNLGLLHWRRGYFGYALGPFSEALRLWKGRNAHRTASTLNNLGTIYFHLGRYESALAAYRESLARRRELGDERGIVLVLNNIGLAYQEWGFPDQAYDMYEEAYEHSRPLDDGMVIGYTLHNLGTILQQQGAYDEALSRYQQGLEASEEAGYVGGVILNLTSMGELYHEQGNDEEALRYLEAARARAEAEGALEQEANAIAQMGTVYEASGEVTKARSYYQESLRVGQELKKQSLIKDNYQRLANLHESTGDLDKALRYYKAYQALQDSVFDERAQRLLADLEMRYEAEKSEKENVVLRAAQERSQLVIGLGSLLLALVLVSLAVLYIMNQQKREANRKLALSNERIAGQRDENKVLLHILSHDLANVFGNVRHCLQLLLEDPDALPEFAPLALQVTNNGIDMITLVRQMHALEEGKVERKPVDLREAVQAASLVVRDRREAKNIALQNDVESGWRVQVEPVTFVGSVLANVLTNAIKFSERGQAVSMRAEAMEEEGRVSLVVRDHGMGMPSHVLDQLFDLQQSSSRPGTEGEHGTGFGMPLVKRFIDLYDGAIEVRSWEAGHGAARGTEVRIMLDAAPPATPAGDGLPTGKSGRPPQPMAASG